MKDTMKNKTKIKFRNILSSYFAIVLLIIGLLQILSSLYGSGVIIILAGIVILLMKNEIKKLKEESDK